MSQKIQLLAIFVITLLFELFFYGRSLFGLGWLVLFALFHAFFFFSNFRSTTGDKKLAYISSILTLCIASIPFWRANVPINAISLLASLYGTALTLYFYKKPSVELQSLSFFQLIVAPLEVFFSLFSRPTPPPTPVEAAPKSQERRSLYAAILKGVFIAIPLIFILIAILSSADPVFARLFAFELDEAPGRIFSALLVFLALLCSARMFIIPRNNKSTAALKPSPFTGIEDLIVVGSIALLFLVFLLIQIRYLFFQIDEHSLLSLGLEFQTYAEYTRQGFEQLLFAAVIVVGVLIAVLSRAQNKRFAAFLKSLNMILIVETTILLLSALRRWWLYFDAHGLTIIRYMGLAFLVWLVGWLTALALQNYFSSRQGSWTRGLLAFSFLTLFSAALLNPDRLIFHNFAPTVNGQVDFAHLFRDTGHDADEFLPPLLDEIDRQWQTISATLSADDTRDDFKCNLITDLLYRKDALFELTQRSQQIADYRSRHDWTEFNLSKSYSSAHYLTEDFHNRVFALSHNVIATQANYCNTDRYTEEVLEVSEATSSSHVAE